MKNLSTKTKEKKPIDYWRESIDKYNASRIIYKLKKHGYTFKTLGEILNIDRHYVYNLMRMNFRLPEGTLQKLEELENETRTANNESRTNRQVF